MNLVREGNLMLMSSDKKEVNHGFLMPKKKLREKKRNAFSKKNKQTM